MGKVDGLQGERVAWLDGTRLHSHSLTPPSSLLMAKRLIVGTAERRKKKLALWAEVYAMSEEMRSIRWVELCVEAFGSPDNPCALLIMGAMA